MNEHEKAVCAIFGLGAIILAYWAVTQTTGQDTTGVPAVQTEAQAMNGMGIAAGMRVNAGTPLDMTPSIHFWAPGINLRDRDSPQTTIVTPHRYPALPGGNMSTVMHRGWSSMANSPPADSGWFDMPPEAAQL